jgi:hypothetical protein
MTSDDPLMTSDDPLMTNDCLPHQVLLADLFGEAADKKEVEEIATAMKEARVTKSYNSFELLASVIGFVPNINLLVPPIHQAVAAATGGSDSLKNVSIARDMLRHAALGLAVNASVELQPLCIYVRGMLLTHLPPKGGTSKLGTPTGGPPAKPGAVVGGAEGDRLTEPKGKKRVAPVGSVLQPMTEPGVTSGSGRNPLAHELSAFAVGMLLSALKRGRFEHHEPTHLALLEPLLPLLQRAMRSDSDPVVSLSLRTVGLLMAYPIPSLPVHATALLERTLQILKRAASSQGTELVSIGVKVVTALLRKPPRPRGAVSGGGGGGGGGTRTSKGAKANKAVDEEVVEEGGGEEGEDEGEEHFEIEGEETLPGVEAAEPRRMVGGGANLNESQLRWLITFVSVHLDDAVLQGSLFGLLRVRAPRSVHSPAWPRAMSPLSPALHLSPLPRPAPTLSLSGTHPTHP